MSNPFNTANKTPAPASERQLEFLLNLVTERADLEGRDLPQRVVDWVKESTKANVSRRIDKAKDTLAELRKNAPVQPSTPSELEDGIYFLEYNGKARIFKVIHAVHGSGRQYAKELDTETGEWVMAPGYVRRFTPADKMDLAKAQEFGHLYGLCVRCGRTLTDEGSIAAGIGPICAGKM